ncbi:hypothetical protein MHYP_G00003790 [Metynnis hypsauchen]
MFFSGVICVWRLETAAKADRQAPKPTARLKPTREHLTRRAAQHVAAAETLTQRANSEETSFLIATLLPLGVREGAILWTGRSGSEQNGTFFFRSLETFFSGGGLCVAWGRIITIMVGTGVEIENKQNGSSIDAAGSAVWGHKQRDAALRGSQPLN